jgi:hypothetical protein
MIFFVFSRPFSLAAVTLAWVGTTSHSAAVIPAPSHSHFSSASRDYFLAPNTPSVEEKKTFFCQFTHL